MLVQIHLPGYTEWTKWTPCATPCGHRTRKRACVNPKPQFGGQDCHITLGPDVETKKCNVEGGMKCVPVDGNYGEWGMWTPCTKECGGGVRARYRSCDHPSPENGGKTCLEAGHGNADDVKPCNVHNCSKK